MKRYYQLVESMRTDKDLYDPRVSPGQTFYLASEADAEIAKLKEEVAMYRKYEHIEGQHEETGRIWGGPRYKLPDRYFEISNESGEPGDKSK